MPSLNKVMLIGNVGTEPEVRYLDGNGQGPQAKVASFRLATTERFRDRNGENRENTEWHSIVAWRSNADVIEKFVHKGTQIFIEGRLRSREYTDQSGNKRTRTEIQVDNLQLLGRRGDADGADGAAAPAQYGAPAQGGYQQQPAFQQPAYQAPAAQPQAPVVDLGIDDNPADDLPF